jgi:hypothetical protein
MLLGLVARLWLRTLRLTVIADPALRLDDPRPWVLAFWHGQQFALLRWARRRRTVALVSLSRDGGIQAAALPQVGLLVERGSSSRGGAAGFRAIVRRIRAAGLDAAFAVDGPRGPIGTVHPGAAAVARATGGLIVPMASACSRCWVLRGAWDRYELPWPLSRVTVVLGAPIDGAAANGPSVQRAIDAARQKAVETHGRDPQATTAYNVPRCRVIASSSSKSSG